MEIKAPAGMLGGAPSMFLCLEEIESASFMFHLCPRGSNEADSMYLRHKKSRFCVSKKYNVLFRKNIQFDPLPRIELFLNIGSRP